MNIGEVIKCRRQKRNITQAELAELLKVTPQAVSRWEMGVSYPDIAMVPKISEILRVSADELLGIKPSDKNREDGDNNTVLNQDQVDSIFDYTPVPVTGKSKKILVVDDADFMRMMLEDILTHQGHTVLQAKDGQECLDILRDEAVDVCLLDIGMPGMDGIEVLRKIKEGQPGLRVVMLSALSQEKNVKQALQLGADAFVVKPFQSQRLIDRI
ncbi:MAG: response regulator [Butyrivibrio sp.]|nr:response regulator [Butyrivibrio sp.]